jgi:transposase-like protein
LGLKRILGLGSYETAWTWLHKIRHAMITPGRADLDGEIEVDETFLGGLEEGVDGRQTFKKALVVIAAQVDGKRIGRIRMRRIPDASAENLMGFIEATIAPGSLVHTDGWSGYAGLTEKGYGHKATIIKQSALEAHELLPRVHLVSSLLKRWITGTHQGAVSPAHLDAYLDEFTFRFNRRTSASRGKLFYRLLQNAMGVTPAPYKKVIKGIRQKPENRRRR